MLDSQIWAASFGSTSSSLLQRAKAQEPEAWQQLVELYSPLVYSWCRAAHFPPQDAADLLQEVFQAVARALARFRRDGPQHSFRGWLRTITQNKLRDYIRARREAPEASGGSDHLQRLLELPADVSIDAELLGEQAERYLVLRSSLQLVHAEFSETTWQAFWRVAVEGQSPADVAADLGLSRNAVYLAKSRILNRLRQEINELLD